jgi:hypothetical protein
VDELNALIDRIVAIANEVLQGTTPPYVGAKQLWDLSLALTGLPEDLLPFVGFASEWEDDPEHRTLYDKRIVLEMERIRRRYGH